MKKILPLFSAIVLLSNLTYGQITVTGSTNADGTYPNLTKMDGVFYKLNNTPQSGGNIVITISGDVTNENGNYHLGGGAWTTLRIQPAGNRTISGASPTSAALLSFNRADNVTIDGLNTGGNSLTIINTLASTVSGTSTINFINDAVNNTITNCTVLGSAKVYSSSTGANIFIGPATATGNDNITISNCKIGPAGANPNSRGIYSNSNSTTITNSNVTITNCEIYDYYLDTGSFAIFAGPGTADWIISNNKIYQTATVPGLLVMYGIYVFNASTGNNIQITGNTIGYSNNSATGTLTMAGGGFSGISIGIGNPSSPTSCTVTNNIISDISIGSTSNPFYGIENNSSLTGTTVNLNNNTIRNITTSTTGSFYCFYTGTLTTGGSVLNAKNNLIENISRTSQGEFYGIVIGKGTDVTIADNTIRNLSVLNTSATSNLYGIDASGYPENLTVSGNSISDLTTISVSSIAIRGINDAGSGAGNKKIKNNIIRNLSASGGATIYGIFTTAASSPDPMDISGNTIVSLSGGWTVFGIYHSSGSAVVNLYSNKISNLTTPSSLSSAVVTGIELYGSVMNNVYNNIVGSLFATESTVKNAVIGMNLKGGSHKVYYNTVYLDAISNSATTFGSSCIYYDSNISSFDLRNNVLVNLSVPAQEAANLSINGMSVCLRCSGGTEGVAPVKYALTSDNNLFWVNPSAGTNNHLTFVEGPHPLFSTITNTKNTVADLRTFLANREQHSIAENPAFLSTTGSDPDYLKPSTIVATGIESGAINIALYTSDIFGNIRQGNPGYSGSGNAPDIGAIEFGGIGIPTSAGRLKDEKEFRVWSYTDRIKIFIPHLTGSKAIVELFDISGQKIQSEQLYLEAPSEIAVPHFKGVGIIRVVSGSEIYAGKVIIR